MSVRVLTVSCLLPLVSYGLSKSLKKETCKRQRIAVPFISPLRGAQMGRNAETIDAKALQFMKCATTSGCLFLVLFLSSPSWLSACPIRHSERGLAVLTELNRIRQ